MVGVDGSPGSIAALRLAVDQARYRGCVLRVVHAWTTPVFLGAPDPFLLEVPVSGRAIDETMAQLESDARRVVDDAIETVGGAETGVTFEPIVIDGRPAQSLLDVAKDADLLVVGARGHGGFLGLRLGSVSQQVTHHATCPVLIVPPPREAGEP